MRPDEGREPLLDLDTAVGAIVGTPVTRILELHREPLDYDAFLAGRSVVRVGGVAATADGRIPFSFIEKVTEGPATASAYLYDNGVREFSAYRSGLLDDLAPTILAPRLLGSERAADGRLTLWLEEVHRSAPPAEVLTVAARHLGALAGRWLGGVPDHPWLFRGWIDRHRQPEAMRDGLAILTAARGDADVDRSLRGRLEEAIDLVRAQDTLQEVLVSLPQTLCHHDAVASNVFHRERGGRSETVLIDWESVGPGPIGADLASLLFSSARRGDIAGTAVAELLPGALDAYRVGLTDAGAQVDRPLVELGLHASIALRWTLARDIVRVLRGPGTIFRGSAPNESPAEAMEELLALASVLLDSAARTRELVRADRRKRGSAE
ncbi:MAG: aminoglycoside phosphotransferase family protein [Chloroflexota bacterium]|nr:aminoglycoside phosphotransferase family protein [Chloroflexota bacterium]